MMGRYQKPAKPGILEQPRNQCNVANDGGGTQLTNLHATEAGETHKQSLKYCGSDSHCIPTRGVRTSVFSETNNNHKKIQTSPSSLM